MPVERGLVKTEWNPEHRTLEVTEQTTRTPQVASYERRTLEDGTVVVCIVEGGGACGPSPPPLAADPASDANIWGLPGSTAADIFQTPPCTFFYRLITGYLTGAKNALCGFWADLESSGCSR